MPKEITRQRLLGLCISSLSVVSTGCVSNLTGSSNCELNHRIPPDPETTGVDVTKLSYSELSDQAKEYYKKTLKADSKTFRIKYNGHNAPEEFKYSDELSTYQISYEESTYTFQTYRDGDCHLN